MGTTVTPSPDNATVLSGRDIAIERRVFQALMRQDLGSFIHKVFQTVDPARRYVHNWHLDAIAWHLQKCQEGRIRRLIITMPPRSLKSICASVAFPAWVLGKDPTAKIICASYATDLTRKHSLDCRTVIDSDWYRQTFPTTRIHPDKNTELEYMTTRRGFRLGTSVGGTLTGRGGNLFIIDDPLKPQEAMSDLKREAVKQWYDGTLYSRLDNKAEDAIILIMQRLHVDDLVGYVLDKEPWVHLNIPAIAEHEHEVHFGPDLIYCRKMSEVLHPERESAATLKIIKANLGTYDFSAQYQQSPVQPGGGMIKWQWFQRYKDKELPAAAPGTQIVQSWDTASKATELADYSVCTTWCVEQKDVYLIDIWRDRLEYPYLKKRVVELSDKHHANTILVEDQGSGTSLIQDLGSENVRCIAINPEGDKATRMSSVSAQIEAGYVFIPEQAAWLQDFQKEILQFPYGRFDDQVDSLSQFLGWHRDKFLYQIPVVAPVSIEKESHFRGF